MATIIDGIGLGKSDNVISGGGSSLFSLWDALTAATDPDDPYETADLDNARVAPVPSGARFIEAHVMHSNTAPISAGALVAFGWVPLHIDNDAPHRVVAAAFDSPKSDADLIIEGLPPGYFIPLYNQGTGNHIQTVSTTSEIQKPSHSSSKVLGMSSGNLYWSCAGCSHVLVFPSTAIAGPSAGLVAGRFSS